MVFRCIENEMCLKISQIMVKDNVIDAAWLDNEIILSLLLTIFFSLRTHTNKNADLIVCFPK